MTPGHAKAARELLAFYQEAGVDALLGETPVDRFTDETPTQTATALAAPAPYGATRGAANPRGRQQRGKKKKR